MNELLELLELHHVLILTNIVLFVIITFIAWDFLWWWNVGDWDFGGRVLFLCMLGGANAFACCAFQDWKKKQ